MTGIMQMFTSVKKSGPTSIIFNTPAQLGTSATHARMKAITCKTSTGLFVSVGYNSSSQPVYATSTTGSNWTTPALMNGSTAVAYMTGITCRQSDGKFVAVGYNSSSQPVYATSTTGSNWTTPALMNGSTAVTQLWSVAVRESDGKFVAVGHTGTALDPDYYLDLDASRPGMVATSTDGSTWTTPYAVDGYRFVGVTVNQTTGRFIAVNSNVYSNSNGVGMSSSLDGVTWSMVVPNGTLQLDTYCWAVAVNNNGVTAAVGAKQNYYTVTSQSASLTSADGFNWPNVTVLNGGYGRLRAVTVTPSGLFVAVGDYFTLQTSNFQQTILHASQPRYYGNSMYSTSTDGYTWTPSTTMGTGVLSRIQGVAVNSAGLVVAVGWNSSDTTQLGAPLYATST